MLFVKRLISLIVRPRTLSVCGSLLDFAGTRISRGYRRILFRICAGALAGSFYRRVTGTPRLEALIGGMIASLLYRTRTFGVENLPENGFLILANHAGIFDSILLQLTCPRPIRFIADASICQHVWLKSVFDLIGAEAIPTSSRRAKQAVQTAVAAIKKGEIVCIFPEGELSRTDMLLKLHTGFELIARLTDCSVIPVWLDGLSDSIFAFKRGKKFLSLTNRFSLRAIIAFGRSIPAREANSGLVRQKLLELGEFCFENRSEISVHLGRAVLAGLKRRQFQLAIIDEESGECTSRLDLLAIGIALSRWIRKKCPAARLGIAALPGIETFVANVAVTLAGKVPVRLPADRASAYTAIHQSRVNQIICSQPAVEWLEELPWLSDVHSLESITTKLKSQIMFWRAMSLVLPAPALAVIMGLPRKGGQKEAAQIFAHNGAEKPTGVVLSHRNIVGSVAQLNAVLKMRERTALMAPTPAFHDSDCVLLLWYPLTQGIPVFIQSPGAEFTRGVDWVKSGTNMRFISILPALFREINPPRFEAIQFVMAPDTSSQKRFYDSKEQLGSKTFLAYGTMETSSAATTNLPDPEKTHPRDQVQFLSRTGSVGKLMPGQAAQIRHPVTGEIGSLFETGMLWLKGVNIFEGLLRPARKDGRGTSGGVVSNWRIGPIRRRGFFIP